MFWHDVATRNTDSTVTTRLCAYLSFVMAGRYSSFCDVIRIGQDWTMAKLARGSVKYLRKRFSPALFNATARASFTLISANWGDAAASIFQLTVLPRFIYWQNTHAAAKFWSPRRDACLITAACVASSCSPSLKPHTVLLST